MMQNSKTKGFTLVEVLIVVFIIGLLSSIVLVGLGSFRARGRDARRLADLRNIQLALESYYSKFNRYPDQKANSPTEWVAFVSTLTDPSNGIGVPSVPKDPRNDARYYYSYGVTDEGSKYVIGARLEDGDNPILNDSISGGNFHDTIGDPYGFSCGKDAKTFCIEQ